MIIKKRIRVVMVQIMAVVMLLASMCGTAGRVAAAGGTGDRLVTPIIGQVGRYKLNYIGSTNYYAWRESNKGVTGEKTYNSAVGKSIGAKNSATVKLRKTSGAQNIKQAMLVWQTRSNKGPTDKIRIIDPKGERRNVIAEKSCVDKRTVSGLTFNTTYCMSVDVTDFVKAGGYGDYTVCNIPVYDPSQDKNIVEKYAKENGLDADSIYPGGETICSWQLIVVEEGKDFPMREVDVFIGSSFALQQDYKTDIGFGAGVTTKTSGTATGQLIFGCSNYSTSVKMTQTATTLNTKGETIKKISGGAIESPGMYKNGSIIKGTDGVANAIGDKTAPKGTGCARVSLDDISNMGGGASSLRLSVVNGTGAEDESTKPDSKKGWTTFFLLGTAFDIETTDFECNQKTTVDSASQVTISDTFKNISSNVNTGIYDVSGNACNITVNIDPNLVVQSVTAKNTAGTKIASGKIGIDNANHKVTITGVENTKKNATVSYEIKCTVVPGMSGVKKFENSDSISGNLYSNGVKTAQYIENAAESSSSGIPKYTVTLKKGAGIQSVTGAGDYTCGQAVTVNASPATGYRFLDWTGDYKSKTQKYTFPMPAKNVSMTANGEQNQYTVKVHAGDGIESVSGAGNYTVGDTVTVSASLLTGYHFLNWTGTLNSTKQTYSFTMPAQDVDLTANGEANRYTIVFDPNYGAEVTHIENIEVKYGESITLPDAKDAYVKYTLDGVNITQEVISGAIVIQEDGSVLRRGEDGSLTAEDGTVTMPDGTIVAPDGTITAPDGTITAPDGTVTLPDGTITAPDGTVTSPDGTVRTPDGAVIMPDGTVLMPDGSVTMPDGTVIPPGGTTEAGGTEDDHTEEKESTEKEEGTGKTGTTEDTKPEDKAADIKKNEISRVLTGTGDADAVEAAVTGARVTGTDTTAAIDTEPQPTKRAYASVFLGWSLEEKRDDLEPQWTAGVEMQVADLADAAGVTDTDGAVITLYAIWDDCPWIQATNLYYTLEQAQSGFITVEEILSHATASDREDGSPIPAGVHADGTSFTIPDYAPTDFTQFRHEGAATENLTVTDSVGSVYEKQITVYVAETAAIEVRPKGTTRFIDEKYYNQPYEKGGLEETSIWKTDTAYRDTLLSAFRNLKNDTPIMRFLFSHEEIKKMKQYVAEYGIGDSRQPGALLRFYEQFCVPNLQ